MSKVWKKDLTATFDGIIDCLRDGGYHTFKELQSATGFTQQRLELLLHFMKEFGFVYIVTPYVQSTHISRAKLAPVLMRLVSKLSKETKVPVDPYPPHANSDETLSLENEVLFQLETEESR